MSVVKFSSYELRLFMVTKTQQIRKTLNEASASVCLLQATALAINEVFYKNFNPVWVIWTAFAGIRIWIFYYETITI